MVKRENVGLSARGTAQDANYELEVIKEGDKKGLTINGNKKNISL